MDSSLPASVIDPFFNIDQENPLDPSVPVAPKDLTNISTLSVGFGSQVLRIDGTGNNKDGQQGLWMGAATFSAAPFSVDMQGNLIASKGTFSGNLTASSIDIPDKVTTNSFHVDSTGRMWIGATTFGAAPLSVSAAGVLTLQNALGTTIIDGTGLISTANFGSGSVIAGDMSTNSTSYVDVSGSELDITLTRNTRVLIIISGIIAADASNGHSGRLALSLNGTDEVGPIVQNSGVPYTGGVLSITSSVASIQTLGPGVNVLKLRAKAIGGGTNFVFQPTLDYVILGS